MSGRGGRESRDRYRRDYPPRSEERSHHGRSSAPPSRHLWVGNLSHSISENSLTHHFLQFGELDSVAFQSGRSYAFINFKNEDDAFAAVKALQGYFVAGNPLKIEFAKAEKETSSSRDEGYSQRRDDQRSRLSPYSQREPRSRYPSPDSSYSEKSKMGDKNAEPSEVIWIGFPASLNVDEVILRRAFSPFGEIDKITAFPGRSYAFVRFKNVIAACRAKEALQGKLFDNPRVHICFARSEMSTSSNSGRSSSQNPAPPSPRYRSYRRSRSPDRYFGNKMQSHQENLRSPLFTPKSENEWFGQGGRFHDVGPELESMYDNRRSPTRERGIRYREFSPPPPLQFPPQYNHDSWDLPEVALLFHGAKKLKTNSFPSENELPEYPFTEAEQVKRVLSRVSDFPQHDSFDMGPLGYKQMPEHMMNLGQPPRGDRSDHWNVPPAAPPPQYDNFQAPVEWKKLTPESHNSSPNNEWKWEGTIAKGGTPVCRARCFPVGKVYDMILPEFLDCRARTDLDMLAKHYYQAAGAWVVFFVPQSDTDIVFYNEFMNYLGEKQRAAVAKLDDKATLFLVPPSEFSEKVLKVPGKLSISGVILRLENPNPGPELGPGIGSLPHLPEKKDPSFMSFETSYSLPLSPSGAYSSMPPPPLPNYVKPGANNLQFAPPVNHHEQAVHQRNGPSAAAAPNWSSPHHLQNPNLGSRNTAPSQVPSSVNQSSLQGYNKSAIPNSSNYMSSGPKPPPPVSSSTAGVGAALQPEQLAQLASSLLGQQRHMGEDFRQTNAMNQPESSYSAPQRYVGPNDNQAAPEFLGSASQYGQPQQMQQQQQQLQMQQQQQQLQMQQQQQQQQQQLQMQQHQQQLLMQQAANTQVLPNQGGTQEEADSDPQQRLQATLNLAAALLHQIQQGKGT